jgi:cAMP-binding proteins - catabolite gene activator and regulatory subunit of cAMP-dependent protein kinases
VTRRFSGGELLFFRGRAVRGSVLREAQAQGRPTPLGIVFEPGMSHQEIAAHVGTVRGLVSRNMAYLQAQGMIRMQGREITILDREGLEAV